MSSRRTANRHSMSEQSCARSPLLPCSLANLCNVLKCVHASLVRQQCEAKQTLTTTPSLYSSSISWWRSPHRRTLQWALSLSLTDRSAAAVAEHHTRDEQHCNILGAPRALSRACQVK